MKEVTLEKDGKIRRIVTKWLTSDEAALYCGISRNTFDLHAEGVPHGGSRTHRRYDVEILDKWINNELSVPFSPPSSKKDRRFKRQRAGPSVALPAFSRRERHVLVDPGTGKTFGR